MQWYNPAANILPHKLCSGLPLQDQTLLIMLVWAWQTSYSWWKSQVGTQIPHRDVRWETFIKLLLIFISCWVLGPAIGGPNEPNRYLFRKKLRSSEEEETWYKQRNVVCVRQRHINQGSARNVMYCSLWKRTQGTWTFHQIKGWWNRKTRRRNNAIMKAWRYFPRAQSRIKCSTIVAAERYWESRKHYQKLCLSTYIIAWMCFSHLAASSCLAPEDSFLV